MKRCKACEQTKETSEFYVGTQRGSKGQVWTYLDSICKVCRKAYSANRRRDIKRQIVEYLGGKCTECGRIDDPCIYDCHHVDDKTKDFSLGKVSNKSFTSIKDEVDKCVLLCCLCHRKLHNGCL
jgi:hypothetical protein